MFQCGNMPEDEYEGIPRNKIPWDPKIDHAKCTTCGKCIDFCHMSVFEFREMNGKKRTAVNLNCCVVFCRGCETVCPAGAITHPSEEKTQEIIDKLKGD